MINNPRRMWTSLIFVVLFAPFVVLLFLSYLTPRTSLNTHVAIASSGGAGSGGTIPAAASGGISLGTGSRAGSPLFAAGDGYDIWVARPRLDENKTPGFELLRRSANTGVWRVASNGGTLAFCTRLGLPQGLAMRLSHGGGAGGSPYVFGEAGSVYQFSLTNFDDPAESLPPSDIVKAVAGGTDQLFAITFGRAWPELHAGDRLPSAKPSAASAPATAAATSTQAATATSPASPPDTFNVYWYPVAQAATGPSTAPENTPRPESGYWSLLPPLGAAGDPAQLPTASSIVALAESKGRLIVGWVDPVRPRSLMTRALAYGAQGAMWSAPVETVLPQTDAVPAVSRLFAISMDEALYVLWTVPTGDSISVHGGWMNTTPGDANAYKMNQSILPMSLGAQGQGISAMDVAVGASGNSLVAVALSRDGVLNSAVFDNKGRELAAAAAVVPLSIRREVQIGQNIAMILVVLMLALSLWQWRQKAPAIVLPKGFVLAPLHLRGGAFLIDILVPYILVLILFSGWDNGPLAMGTSWLALPAHPEDFAKAWDLFTFIGLYLGHVVVGEMFYRRSIGKALVGLEVRMLDGKPPTVAAVLIRSVLLIPECAVGIVLLYIVVSDRRQRLGDLLAKTVVVAQSAVEMPEDPDGKKSK